MTTITYLIWLVTGCSVSFIFGAFWGAKKFEQGYNERMEELRRKQ